MPGDPRSGLGRAVVVVGLAACVAVVAQPSGDRLSVEACQYYAACEPAFALAFAGVDPCIAALDADIDRLDVCRVGPEVQADCAEQLHASTASCVPIDEGACGAMLGCLPGGCELAALNLLERCGLDVNPEIAVAFCSVDRTDCLQACFESRSCDGTAEPAALVTTCLEACDLL